MMAMMGLATLGVGRSIKLHIDLGSTSRIGLFAFADRRKMRSVKLARSSNQETAGYDFMQDSEITQSTCAVCT